MRRTLLAAALMLVAATSTWAGGRRLTILHTNDTHSHLDPFYISAGVPNGGGVIERAAFIDSVRKADGRRHVLVLDAGDISQGSSYFSILKGVPESNIVREMGVDVMTLGNHEFDNGPDALAQRLKRQLPVKVVCANYDFGNHELSLLVKPFTIVRRGGFKIGIIGLMPDLGSLVDPKNIKGLRKLDTVESLNKWSDFLRKVMHCDLIIALTHLGYNNEEYTDVELAGQTRGVDVIIGGHSHTNLKEAAVVNNIDGEPVTIVTDYCWGRYVGVMKITD